MTAVSITEPRIAGFHEQLAVKFGDTPEVIFLIHPAILFPLAKKLTREETETLIDIRTGVL
jgi:hypothetical protein